jgi:predicted GNAT family acetyltransferase
MVDREPVSDSMIDEELEETFPASDAPGHTVETGIRIAPPPSPRALVVDNAAASRFEVTLDGQVAYLRYERTATALTIVHTEVPLALRGHQIAALLVEAALDSARSNGLRVVAVCPFARAYLRKHSRRQA